MIEQVAQMGDKVIERVNGIGWFVGITLARQVINDDAIAGVGKGLYVGLKVTPTAGAGAAAMDKDNGIGGAAARWNINVVSL